MIIAPLLNVTRTFGSIVIFNLRRIEDPNILSYVIARMVSVEILLQALYYMSYRNWCSRVLTTKPVFYMSVAFP
jgi:hypothetical protein